MLDIIYQDLLRIVAWDEKQMNRYSTVTGKQTVCTIFIAFELVVHHLYAPFNELDSESMRQQVFTSLLFPHFPNPVPRALYLSKDVFYLTEFDVTMKENKFMIKGS